jgi:hypothetical protein
LHFFWQHILRVSIRLLGSTGRSTGPQSPET